MIDMNELKSVVQLAKDGNDAAIDTLEENAIDIADRLAGTFDCIAAIHGRCETTVQELDEDGRSDEADPFAEVGDDLLQLMEELQGHDVN